MSAYTHLEQYVQKWTRENRLPVGAAPDSDESFEDILRQINFMIEHSYSRYVPAMYSKHSPIFQDRMVAWLQNNQLEEEDRIALFQFVLRLAYFSFDDFIGLYRTAYSNSISRWVWDQAKLHMDLADCASRLETERSRHTWYVAVTDSLIISEFYHANSISGIGCRPNFLTLKEFGDPCQIKRYMAEHDLKRIVLLEDFVGSGTQAERIVQWALDNCDVSILFCPMLICPDGLRRFSNVEANSLGRLKVEPVVRLGDSEFLSTHDREDAVLNHIATLAHRIHSCVAGSSTTGAPPYGPHGFHRQGDRHTGATVVLFSNTPNNTIPLVHHNSSASHWNPVFPRVSRENS